MTTTNDTKTTTAGIQTGFEVRKAGKLIQFIVTVDPATGTATEKGALSIPLPYSIGYKGSAVISAELDGLTYYIYNAKSLYVKETQKQKEGKTSKGKSEKEELQSEINTLNKAIETLPKTSQARKNAVKKLEELTSRLIALV
jgi:vacuolar-type H+-ATPase subunit I/STV1